MKIEQTVIAWAIDIWSSVGAKILRRANWATFPLKKGVFNFDWWFPDARILYPTIELFKYQLLYFLWSTNSANVLIQNKWNTQFFRTKSVSIFGILWRNLNGLKIEKILNRIPNFQSYRDLVNVYTRKSLDFRETLPVSSLKNRK